MRSMMDWFPLAPLVLRFPIELHRVRAFDQALHSLPPSTRSLPRPAHLFPETSQGSVAQPLNLCLNDLVRRPSLLQVRCEVPSPTSFLFQFPLCPPLLRSQTSRLKTALGLALSKQVFLSRNLPFDLSFLPLALPENPQSPNSR